MPPSDTDHQDGFIPPSIPTRAYMAPSGPGWVSEIKHDGYRLQVRRDGDAVRLFTRRGYDWTTNPLSGDRGHRGPPPRQIVHARRRSGGMRARTALPLDALHRRGTVSEAMMYAFDLLKLDGEDLRPSPLVDRKKRLGRLLGKRRAGIVLGEHTDKDGAAIFQ
jgi:bifunctional non-homologous end joining protein LigD